MVRGWLKVSLVGLAALGATSALAEKKGKHIYPRSESGSASAKMRGEKLEVGVPDLENRIHVRASAGVAGFNGGLAGRMQPGPVLGVSVAGEASRLAEVEMGYQAQRNGIDDPRVGDGEGIYRHNVNVFGKLGPKLADAVRPYVGIGLGASYANATEGAEGAYRNDFFQEVPIGAGLDFSRGGLTAGIKGTWTALFNDEFAELTPSADNPDDARMISGLVTVGGRF